MRTKLRFVLTIAAVVLFLDQLTKWLIVRYVPLGSEVAVWTHFFDIVHGRNTGAAFGFMNDWDSGFKDVFFYFIGIVALIFLYHYLKSVSQKDKVTLGALSFILGGALGNIVDRIFRGSVVDFLSFHYYDRIFHFHMLNFHASIPLYWPAFNVADMAISTAVVVLICRSVRHTQNV